MYRTIAKATQWCGRLTVIVAAVFLIYTVYQIADDSRSGFGFGGPGRTTAYINVVAQAASIATMGMLAVGIGALLERVSNE